MLLPVARSILLSGRCFTRIFFPYFFLTGVRKLPFPENSFLYLLLLVDCNDQPSHERGGASARKRAANQKRRGLHATHLDHTLPCCGYPGYVSISSRVVRNLLSYRCRLFTRSLVRGGYCWRARTAPIRYVLPFRSLCLLCLRFRAGSTVPKAPFSSHSPSSATLMRLAAPTTTTWARRTTFAAGTSPRGAVSRGNAALLSTFALSRGGERAGP